MKAFLKRIWHILLIGAGLVIPTVAALSDATGDLGKFGRPGIVGIAVIGVLVNVGHMWKPPESAVYKRWLSMLGTFANVATPLLTFMYTKLPPDTKGYLFLGTACALAGSWRNAFGAMGKGLPQSAAPTSDDAAKT